MFRLINLEALTVLAYSFWDYVFRLIYLENLTDLAYSFRDSKNFRFSIPCIFQLIILRITNRCHVFQYSLLYVTTLHVSLLYQPIIRGIPSCCYLLQHGSCGSWRKSACVWFFRCSTTSKAQDARGHTPSNALTKWQQVTTARDSSDDGLIEARTM